MVEKADKLSEEERNRLMMVYTNDVGEFARVFFAHLLTSESAEFHKKIYDEIRRHYFMSVQVFRGGAKSTIGLIIYSIWFSIFARFGNISLISKSEQFILNDIMRVIKNEFEGNERMRYFFGDLTTSKWSESYFVIKTGISFEGCGINGQLRGGRKGLIMLDDLEDEESAKSEEQREKLRARINKELIPKLVDMGQMVYFGTPVCTMAYINQIHNIKGNGWYKLRFPAYKDGVEKEGNEAWPQLYPHERLQHLKKMIGSNAFASEYLCKPVSDETQPIKEEMIKEWTELPIQRTSVLVLDPAYSEDETADWKVASLVSIDVQQNRYLSTYVRTHRPLGEYIDEVINLWLSNRGEIMAVGVPNAGVEKAFYDSFLKRCNERNVFPPVIEIKNSFTGHSGISIRNKKARIIAALQRLFETGKYYIHANHLEARDEILNVRDSRWDDIIDTMASAEQLFYQNSFVPEKVDETDVINISNAVRTGTFGYGY